MRNLFLTALIVTAFAAPSRAAPPPPGSEEAQQLKGFAQWFGAQKGAWGFCCSVADGRIVDVRIHGGHYEVRFLHPETIEAAIRPVAGTYYRVRDDVVLHVPNPTGRPVAWWSEREMFDNGKSIGHIICFVNANLY